MTDIGLILEGISSLEEEGGVATWARNLVQSLPDRTFAIISFVNSSNQRQNHKKYINTTTFYSICISTYPTNVEEILSKIHLDSLPKCTLYHASSTGCASLLGMNLAKEYKVPFLLTEHAIYWKEIQNSHELECGIRLEPAYTESLRRIAQEAYQKANRITSPASFIRNQQIEEGADPDKTIVIPNGVSIEKKNTKYNWNIETIGFVGRITRIKNLERFLCIAEALLKINKNLQFKIIGPVVDLYYFHSLEKWIEEHSLQNKILFTGPLSFSVWSKTIDCLLLTSFMETQPYVILEAFSQQIPVIASSVGGITETVGSAGCILSLELDAQVAAKKIDSLLMNPTLLKDYVEEGWYLVQNKYHIDSMNKNYNSLYQPYLKSICL